MSDSDDYMPNGEDNLSIMSDVMERSSDLTEIDLDEINDVLLKNIESDVFNMQNEVKQKDLEMQQLLEEIQRQYFAQKDQEFLQIKAAEEYEEKIEGLQVRVGELQGELQEQKEQIQKYSGVIDTLEAENEKLKEENKRQEGEIAGLNEKLQKQNRTGNNKSTTANSSAIMTVPPSPIGTAHAHWFQKSLIAEKNKNGLVLDFVDDVSNSDFDPTFLKANDPVSHQVEESWINKLELLREKLVNEQNKSRELEFMVVTQKNLIENTNENMAKLKQDNKTLEAKIEKLRAEIDSSSRSKTIERTKMDNVVTFLELIENCVFPEIELVEKLSEIPIMIVSYLKGLTETISFNQKQNSQSKLVFAASKIKETLERINQNVSKEEKIHRVGRTATELDEIRSEINHLTQFLAASVPYNERQGLSLQSDGRSVSRDNHRENFSDNLRDSSPNGKQQANANANYKSSFFLTRAVQNSNSLLWNFQQAKNINHIGQQNNKDS